MPFLLSVQWPGMAVTLKILSQQVDISPQAQRQWNKPFKHLSAPFSACSHINTFWLWGCWQKTPGQKMLWRTWYIEYGMGHSIQHGTAFPNPLSGILAWRQLNEVGKDLTVHTHTHNYSSCIWEENYINSVHPDNKSYSNLIFLVMMPGARTIQARKKKIIREEQQFH